MVVSLVISIIALILSAISTTNSLCVFFKEKPKLKIDILSCIRFVGKLDNTFLLEIQISNQSQKDISIKSIYLRSKNKYIAEEKNELYGEWHVLNPYRDIPLNYYGSITLNCYFQNYEDYSNNKHYLEIKTPIKSFNFNASNAIKNARKKELEL